MGIESSTHIDDLPPENRAAAKKVVADHRAIKPTPEQIALALKVFTEVKDYSKVSTLISAAAQTLEDALKRTP